MVRVRAKPNPNPNPIPNPNPNPSCTPIPTQVQACLPEKGWQIPPEDIGRRLDLRNGRALVRSIDP